MAYVIRRQLFRGNGSARRQLVEELLGMSIKRRNPHA
jgi:hypothetical protein